MLEGQFRLDGEDVGQIVRWIGHDAVIFGGNSGGPLVNLQGEIVGINEIGLGSLGGAIPANLAREVVRQLIEHGRVSRSWIGLEFQHRLKSDKNAGGVLVAGVVEGSPAAQGGNQGRRHRHPLPRPGGQRRTARTTAADQPIGVRHAGGRDGGSGLSPRRQAAASPR